jgi:hypothetical protein
MWSSVNPHLPQPANAEDAEVCLHLARTAAATIDIKLRAYSHRWLTERKYPSQLPDKLKPRAERMFPVVASAAGFAWGSASAILQPAKPYVDRAVSARVEELFANGDGHKVDLVRDEMISTKNKTLKSLFHYRESPEEITR